LSGSDQTQVILLLLQTAFVGYKMLHCAFHWKLVISNRFFSDKSLKPPSCRKLGCQLLGRACGSSW